MTRDNDFAGEDGRTDLAEFECRLLFGFQDALDYVCSRLD